MLQNRVNWLINAYKAACRLRGFKSDLVKEEVPWFPKPAIEARGRGESFGDSKLMLLLKFQQG